MNRVGTTSGNEWKEFFGDVVVGLTRRPKSIPGKYLWDEAGSVLFDRICGTQSYYPTRYETALLERHACEVAELAGPGVTLVELGSGASHKSRILLDTLRDPRSYVAIDISADYLAAATARLASDYPELEIIPVVADYTKPLRLPAMFDAHTTLGFFPGSTIGNFGAREATAFLARIREALGSSWLLLGADPNQEPERLSRAYADEAGLMAALHRNVLVRLSRELDSNIDPENFLHEARIFDDPARVEAHLVAQHAANYRIGAHVVRFARGESIRTDYSYKYSPDAFRELAVAAGWKPWRCWLNPDGLFNLHLLRA
jgi:dimethylhistidine N-methyltransferase